MDNQKRDERAMESGQTRADAETLDLGDLYPPEPNFGASFAELRSELLERWSRLSRGGAIPTEGLLQPVGIDLRNEHSTVLTRMGEDQLQIVHMGSGLRHLDDPRRNEKGAFLRFIDCLGEQAIESGLPLDFEHWDNFRPGMEEPVRGLALPLSEDGRRCTCVVAIFDSEAMAAGILSLDAFPVDEELLLDEEADQQAEPRPAPKDRSKPFFMVATSNRPRPAMGFRHRPPPGLKLTSTPSQPEPPEEPSAAPEIQAQPAHEPEPEAAAPIEPENPGASSQDASSPDSSSPDSSSPDESLRAEAAADRMLAQARDLAQLAAFQEQRSHFALYDALGAAYELMHRLFAVPERFAEILAEAGLTMQERAPMTPVVKLVFGPHYDRTRLSEYAAVLGYAHRQKLPDDQLGEYLKTIDGGVRAVVQKEREARQGHESGEGAGHVLAPQIVKRLRRMPARGFEAIDRDGEEFALVMVRRSADGSPQVIGEVPSDKALLNRASRKLIVGSR